MSALGNLLMAVDQAPAAEGLWVWLQHEAPRLFTQLDGFLLDLTRAFSLDFAPPDTDTFRCLALARAAGEAGGTAPCTLNAANEEAGANWRIARARYCSALHAWAAARNAAGG